MAYYPPVDVAESLVATVACHVLSSHTSDDDLLGGVKVCRIPARTYQRPHHSVSEA